MKIFRLDESYVIRHEILGYLFEKSKLETDYQNPTKKYSLQQISVSTGIPIDKLDKYHELLHEEKQIHCNFCSDDPIHWLKITMAGRQAFIYQTYLNQGRTERRNRIKDYSAIISPIISVLSLVIAIIAVSKSSDKSPKEDIVKIQIESKVPELKIKELKEAPNQSKNRHQ